MKNLSQIFPINYPNPPSEEDLQFEVQDMLRHADSPMDILDTINKIPCPYYRKAIASMTPCHWHDMEHMGKEPAVYIDSEGHGRITWINIDADIRKIIKQANAEQIALEQQPLTINTPYSMTHNPNPTTMPIFIHRHEGTINHNEYHNCTIYQGAPVPQPQAEPEPQAEETTQSAPAIPAFFRTDAHAITAIEQLWKQALALPTKTKVIRFLLQHDHTDGYFHLNHLSYQRRAELLNEAQDKFIFKAKDFENANN